MSKNRAKLAQKYLDETKQLLSKLEDNLENIDEIVSLLIAAQEKGNTIFVMGNGGSAATASHFVNDLTKLTICEKKPRFRIVSLNDNIPLMLAWANDTAYKNIFVEQLKNLFKPGDVVIGISGSGNSANVIKAIEYANTNKGMTVGLVGYDGGRLISLAQKYIHVPTFNMQHAEDMHLLVLHKIVSLIKNEP